MEARDSLAAAAVRTMKPTSSMLEMCSAAFFPNDGTFSKNGEKGFLARLAPRFLRRRRCGDPRLEGVEGEGSMEANRKAKRPITAMPSSLSTVRDDFLRFSA